MDRTFLVSVMTAASLVLSGESALPVSAQANSCPIVTDAVMTSVLGVPVEGQVNPDQPRGMDVCYFTKPDETDFAIERLPNAFGPDNPGGPAALAKKFVPNLTDAIRSQLDALSQGSSMSLPDHQLVVVDGLGDYAVSALTQIQPGYLRDSLMVELGNDAYVFEVDDDTPDAQAQLRTIATAVLSAASQTPTTR